MSNKQEILEWYCEESAKNYSYCKYPIDNCRCWKKNALSKMLAELIDSAPLTGSTYGESLPKLIGEWKKQQKEGAE